MKIRQGFVSNSSSSSFVIAATLPAVKEALSRMKDDREIKIIESIMETDTVFGTKAKIIKELRTLDGVSSIWGYNGNAESEILEKAKVERPDNEEDWTPSDVVYNYVNIIEKMAKEKEWKDQIFQCAIDS